jgi:DNA-binding CsgD family transcriptional regulator
MAMSPQRSPLPIADPESFQLVPVDPALDPLPRPMTSFVGRERELDAVTKLIDMPEVRLVTLTGPGGAGKTRLAIAVARHHEPAYPNGVAFVPFETTTDPAQVAVLIAQATGVPDVPGRPLAARMRDHFHQRALLLVLDNLEHLPGIETHVANLLTASQRLKVLCTSRAPLGIAGEQVYPVPPLHPAEAARLLIESAAAYAAPQDLGGVRAVLTELGRVALTLDQLETATALLVAAHALPAHDHDRPTHDAAIAEAARRIGQATREARLAAGPSGSSDDLLDLARSLVTASPPSPDASPAGLSPREREVLRLLTEGQSNRAIAETLSVSPRTVENHVLHIMSKLNLDSRTAAVAYAIRNGLV